MVTKKKLDETWLETSLEKLPRWVGHKYLQCMLVTFRFRRGGIQHGGLAGTREMHYITMNHVHDNNVNFKS